MTCSCVYHVGRRRYDILVSVHSVYDSAHGVAYAVNDAVYLLGLISRYSRNDLRVF